MEPPPREQRQSPDPKGIREHLDAIEACVQSHSFEDIPRQVDCIRERMAAEDVKRIQPHLDHIDACVVSHSFEDIPEQVDCIRERIASEGTGGS